MSKSTCAEGYSTARWALYAGLPSVVIASLRPGPFWFSRKNRSSMTSVGLEAGSPPTLFLAPYAASVFYWSSNAETNRFQSRVESQLLYWSLVTRRFLAIKILGQK